MISDTIIFEKYPSYIEYHPAFFFNFLFLQRPFSNNTRLVETVAINRRKKNVFSWPFELALAERQSSVIRVWLE